MNVALHTPGLLGGNDVVVVTIPGLPDPKTKPGEQTTLTVGDQSFGSFQIMDMWAGSLHHIPAALLEIHHDPLCRTFTGLCVMTQSVYGREAVAQGSKLTALVLQKPKADAIRPANPSEIARVLGAQKKG